MKIKTRTTFLPLLLLFLSLPFTVRSPVVPLLLCKHFFRYNLRCRGIFYFFSDFDFFSTILCGQEFARAVCRRPSCILVRHFALYVELAGWLAAHHMRTKNIVFLVHDTINCSRFKSLLFSLRFYVTQNCNGLRYARHGDGVTRFIMDTREWHNGLFNYNASSSSSCSSSCCSSSIHSLLSSTSSPTDWFTVRCLFITDNGRWYVSSALDAEDDGMQLSSGGQCVWLRMQVSRALSFDLCTFSFVGGCVLEMERGYAKS